MPTTRLLLVTGEQVEVSGPPADVAKELENAARSSHGTLAWFEQPDGGDRIAVNGAHVVTVQPGSA